LKIILIVVDVNLHVTNSNIIYPKKLFHLANLQELQENVPLGNNVQCIQKKCISVY